MLNDILIFSGDEVFESTSDPLVPMHLFSFLFVIHGNSVVVLEVILELFGFLELLEEKLVERVLTRAVFRIHAL